MKESSTVHSYFLVLNCANALSMVNKRPRRRKRANTLMTVTATQLLPVSYAIDLSLLPLESLIRNFKFKIHSEDALLCHQPSQDSLECESFTVHASRKSTDETHPVTSAALEADAQVQTREKQAYVQPTQLSERPNVRPTQPNEQSQPNVQPTKPNIIIQPTKPKVQPTKRNEQSTQVHQKGVTFCHICCTAVPTHYMGEHTRSVTHVSQLQLAYLALKRLNQHYKRLSAAAVQNEDEVNGCTDYHYCISCNVEVKKAQVEIHERELKHKEAVRTDEQLTELYQLYDVSEAEHTHEADSYALVKYVAANLGHLRDELKETYRDETSDFSNEIEDGIELRVGSSENHEDAANNAVEDRQVLHYLEAAVSGSTDALRSFEIAMLYRETNCVMDSSPNDGDRDQDNPSYNAFSGQNNVNTACVVIKDNKYDDTENATPKHGLIDANTANAETDYAKNTPENDRGELFLELDRDHECDIDVPSHKNSTREDIYAKEIHAVHPENPSNKSSDSSEPVFPCISSSDHPESEADVTAEKNVDSLISSAPKDLVRMELDRIKQMWTSAGWREQLLILEQRFEAVAEYVATKKFVGIDCDGETLFFCNICQPLAVNDDHWEYADHHEAHYKYLQLTLFMRAEEDLNSRFGALKTCEGEWLTLTELQWHGIKVQGQSFKCLLCNEVLDGLDQPYRHMLEREPSEHWKLLNAPSINAVRKTCTAFEYHCAVCNDTFVDDSHLFTVDHELNVIVATSKPDPDAVMWRKEDHNISRHVLAAVECCVLL